MEVLRAFATLFLLGTLTRFVAVWLIGSAFLLEESKTKAAIIAIISSSVAFLFSMIPFLNILSGVLTLAVSYSLFKFLYDSSTGGVLGSAFLVETVNGGIIYGLGILLTVLGL